MNYTIANLQKEYNIELEKAVKKIQKLKPKSVLLQFPDGLKPWATTIANYLEEKTNTEIRIWLGSCFGACDLPKTEADLVIQFGHSPWN